MRYLLSLLALVGLLVQAPFFYERFAERLNVPLYASRLQQLAELRAIALAGVVAIGIALLAHEVAHHASRGSRYTRILASLFVAALAGSCGLAALLAPTGQSLEAALITGLADAIVAGTVVAHVARSVQPTSQPASLPAPTQPLPKPVPAPKPRTPPATKTWICPECSQEFGSQQALAGHRNKHRGTANA